MTLAEENDVIGLERWLDASPRNRASINFGSPRVWQAFCLPSEEGYDGPTLMTTAIGKKSHSMVRMLLSKGCDIKYRRRSGDNAFIDALWEGCTHFYVFFDLSSYIAIFLSFI